jgi:hypothetical protein
MRNWRIDEEFATLWSANDMADTLLSFGMNALMDYVLSPDHRHDRWSLSTPQKAQVHHYHPTPACLPDCSSNLMTM